jgi:hypothetical protein
MFPQKALAVTDLVHNRPTENPPFHPFQVFSIALRISGAMLLLVAIGGRAVAAEQKEKPETCAIAAAYHAGLNADDSTEVGAVGTYKNAVGRLLEEEKFKELDCIADTARSSKERFSGGMWKLHILYAGLEMPLLHPTQQDWQAHLNRLKRWVSRNPDSITARVALAGSYVQFGWDARGDGYANTVSASGWKLFGERVAEAKRILEKASALPIKCPEWYVAMQTVALAQSWDGTKARALLEQAAAFEPAYYYYYRLYADFILPKWNGEPGDSEKFAAEAADRIGGEQGDATYFQIAAYMICHCNAEPQLQDMSWPKIQRGFAILEKQRGPSLTNLNLAAYMAIKNKDAVTADKLFTRIGEHWDEDTWRKQAYFESSKTWAAQVAPSMAQQRSIEDSADANMQSIDGARYRAAFDEKFENLARQCVQTAGSDQGKFEMLVSVGKDGSVERMTMNPSTGVGRCLFQKLMEFQMTHTAAFPPPPQPSYWIKLDLDPSVIARVAPN